MNKPIIAALLAGATLSASADMTPVSFADKVVVPTAKTAKAAQSRKFKRLPEVNTGTIQIKKRIVSRTGTTPDGYVMFEGFEGWDGTTLDWTPEGWTVEMKGDVDREYSWTPVIPNPNLPSAPEGQYYYGISLSATANQDEWLISPEVEIEDGMVATFSLYLNPVFLFKFDQDHVDFDKWEFIGEKEVAATLQLLVLPEGEQEWSTVYDVVDEYRDMTLSELRPAYTESFDPHTVDLSEFAGKKIKLAFRYVGIDGDTMFIDAIGIGYPLIENISYLDPWSTLYWGFDRSAMLNGSTAPIAIYPVFTDLTWQNVSETDATFQWEYEDPDHKDNFLTSDEQSELTVNYKPDYSSATTKKNNFYRPHTLNASAPKQRPGSYSAPYFLQAGGKAETTFNDGSEFDGTMLPFSFPNQGLTMQFCEDTEAGVLGIPVFGYDELGHVDDYWLNYSLNGQEATESDYSHLTGIANLFMPTEAPLAVNGLTLYAWGQIDADAELTATIYGLDAEMNKYNMSVIATATCKGSAIACEYPDANGYMAIPFDFTEPVVIKATDEHPAYFFMIENFRSDKVKFFAPLQSALPGVLNWGYIRHDIDISATGQPAYTNIKPMVYKEDINDPDSYVDPMGAFAIGINGEYPWLTCETGSIEITDEAPEAKVALGSYYDGSKLTVDAPESLIATVSGRYDECTLTVSRKPGTPAITDGVITVSGPGVEVAVKVTAEEAGIHEITSAANGAEKIFDLQGRRVVNATKGNIYIVNGSKTIL